MRPSERGAWIVAGGSALLLGLLAVQPAAAAGPALGKLRIESDPSGAEVVLIGGSAGYTPLTISERALYPNDYPDDKAHLYGTVTLRRPGCETVVHRVTRGDLGRGLTLTLDCGAGAHGADTHAAASLPARRAADAVAPAPASSPRAVDGGESASQRRLRQLQVLQELLDEGFVTGAEEARIRRRLLEPAR